MNERSYGYNDPALVDLSRAKWNFGKVLVLLLAILFIVGVWLALDQKLLFGDDWMSETYDNPDWRTNEGNLHTYGAWDLETHIWKTEYIIENFPNFHWNQYWYLGMPLLKYYQSGFYVMHIFVWWISGLSLAKSALYLVVFSHLLATLLTFLLCYKLSRRIWVAALCSTFVLSNTFLSLRSYGWEPITVVFLFLYPLGLLVFFKEPLKPFRFWMIVVMALAYLCHPLLFFSLCMTMGLYLFSIAIIHRKDTNTKADRNHYIWKYFALIFVSLLVGAVQFFPQMSYEQVTSGAHMGVKYLPFYHVKPNIITPLDFFFDAGNLKGPGPIIMISFFLLATFAIIGYRNRISHPSKMLRNHEIITGLTFAVIMMVLFYYLELYNLFPMNYLRSIQYHRIIPEFIITAAALVAALSNMAYTHKHKIFYYTMLITFVLASGIIIFVVQTYWQTTTEIASKPEFLSGDIKGRITFPYTDQSLAVRNSFTYIPQTYGYYEQGITNPYADEVFSVSSGFQNADLTVLYLKAANVGRIYINNEEGDRDKIMVSRLTGILPYTFQEKQRYSYFEVPLENPSFVQAVDGERADYVQEFRPECRELYKEIYCGSQGEEFVGRDPAEVQYLEQYVEMVEGNYDTTTIMTMNNPDHYTISVEGAEKDTAIIIKMTYDKDFTATLDGQEIEIDHIGPYFMLLRPQKEGTYEIELEYNVSRPVFYGAIVSMLSFLILAFYFAIGAPSFVKESFYRLKRGDMK